MYFLHADEIWSRHPSLAVLTMVVDEVRAMRRDPAIVAPLVEETRARLAVPEAEMPEIAAWREAFSRMGLKPTQYRCASEALLRRFRKEGALPQLHPVVDYLNFASMSAGIPIAVFDRDEIAGGLIVRQAHGDERYLTFQGEIETPAQGETIFADEKGAAHARRWTNRQSALSAVGAETDRVLIVSEAHHPGARSDLTALEHRLARDLTALGARVLSAKTLDSQERRLDL
ncbi:phenylalanine--tRNA ligase beta subunit-related protein [Salinarimonas sp.]|uniref:B3/B4 domain-containing protein n=1 Tax=Salinarimonas sp. TaxID=2766526 RepID=UPI0032D96640